MEHKLIKIGRKKEDEYFAREEFERLAKLAEEQSAKLKEREREEIKALHWMHCPKDGAELIELDYMGVLVDKCTHCGGIYLDHGELERLLEIAEQEHGILGKFLKLFG